MEIFDKKKKLELEKKELASYKNAMIAYRVGKFGSIGIFAISLYALLSKPYILNENTPQGYLNITNNIGEDTTVYIKEYDASKVEYGSILYNEDKMTVICKKDGMANSNDCFPLQEEYIEKVKNNLKIGENYTYETSNSREKNLYELADAAGIVGVPGGILMYSLIYLMFSDDIKTYKSSKEKVKQLEKEIETEK